MRSLAVELGTHLAQLKARFLPDEKLRELNEPEHFQNDFDARAFLILVHSAFEQFFEDLASNFALASVDAWTKGSVPSKQLVVTLACLATSMGGLDKSLSPTRDEAGTGVTGDPRSKLTLCLLSAIPVYQAELERNHGTDISYLRSLFVPLGIYLDPPPDAMSALTHIANARGTFAHRRTILRQGRFAYKPISATKALEDTQHLFWWCINLEESLLGSIYPSSEQLLNAAKRDLLRRLALQLSWIAQLR